MCEQNDKYKPQITQIISSILEENNELKTLENENFNMIQDYIEEDMENFSIMQDLEEKNEVKRLSNISLLAKSQKLCKGKFNNIFKSNLLETNKENHEQNVKNNLIKVDIFIK